MVQPAIALFGHTLASNNADHGFDRFHILPSLHYYTDMQLRHASPTMPCILLVCRWCKLASQRSKSKLTRNSLYGDLPALSSKHECFQVFSSNGPTESSLNTNPFPKVKEFHVHTFIMFCFSKTIQISISQQQPGNMTILCRWCKLAKDAN